MLFCARSCACFFTMLVKYEIMSEQNADSAYSEHGFEIAHCCRTESIFTQNHCEFSETQKEFTD